MSGGRASEIRPCFSCSEEDSDVDERKVPNVSFRLFYKQHRILAIFLLLFACLFMMYFSKNIYTIGDKMYRGFLLSSIFLLIVSSLVFPNGPFIRPHPLLWKVSLGMCVVYCIILIFFLFLDYQDIKNLLIYIDPQLRTYGPDLKNYAEDCRFVWSIIKEQIDIFCLFHFLGWYVKMLLIRDFILVSFFSVTWEVSEIFFRVLLPNFKECWWDVLILDILVCNGLGILAGYYTLKWLEYRDYHWESLKMIKDTRGKLKRFVLQFSPEQYFCVYPSLDPSNWFSTDSVFLRIFQLTLFSTFWHISELNTFFLKHIFMLNTRHWLVILRCNYSIVIAFPAVRQFYEYMTNPRIRKLGIYSWMFLVMSVLELFVMWVHGDEVLTNFSSRLIISWLLFQVFIYLPKKFKGKRKTL